MGYKAVGLYYFDDLVRSVMRLGGVLPLALAASLCCGIYPSAAFAADGASPEPDIRAAAKAMIEGRYDDASQEFQRVVDAEPDNVEAIAGLGMALGRANKYDEADVQFDKVLQLNPKNPVAHCGKAMVLLGRVQNNQLSTGMTKKEALHQAGRECNQALDADSRVVEAHYLLGKVYKEEGRLDLAIQAFSGAIRLDPHYANAYNALGSVQFTKGNYSEAIEDYKQVLAIAPKSSVAHIGLGEVYLKQVRPEDAIQELSIALASNPNNASVHLMMARAMELRNNPQGALAEYEEAIKLKPDMSEAYLALAAIQENRGEFGLAADQLAAALKAVPDDAQMRLRLAEDYLKSRRLESAAVELRTVLNANPSLDSAATELARVYFLKTMQEPSLKISASPEFQAAAKDLAQAAQGPNSNLVIKFADAEMKVLAGERVDLGSLPVPHTDAERLAAAEAYLAQRKYPEAGALLMAAINNCYTGKGLCDLGDQALLLRDLDSADVAYKRATSFLDMDARSKHGLNQVSQSRQDAIMANADGNRLGAAKQYPQAIDKFRTALSANPKFADAHLGLADALDHTAATAVDPGINLHEALIEYRLYLILAPNVFPRDQEKVQHRIDRLETIMAKARENPNIGWHGLLQKVSLH